MAAMKAMFRSNESEGTSVNVYGYAGVVQSDGTVLVDVPDDLVAGEVACGRLEATATDAKAKGKTKSAGAADGDTSTP